MNARDELEAAVWKALARPRQSAASLTATVEAILTAADTYAITTANAVTDTPVATARRRAVLEQALTTHRSTP